MLRGLPFGSGPNNRHLEQLESVEMVNPENEYND